MSHPILTTDQFVLRRKVLRLIGAGFHFYDAHDKLLAFAELKGFKLKEDLRIFADEAKSQELIRISARQILDISANYDVFDSTIGEKVGVLQRKGLKSILRDEWLIKDAQDREIGMIFEDNWALAIFRRIIALLPQRYDAVLGGVKVADLHQNFNPFVFKLAVDFTPDRERRFDRRLGLAAALLLAAIEGRQK